MREGRHQLIPILPYLPLNVHLLTPEELFVVRVVEHSQVGRAGVDVAVCELRGGEGAVLEDLLVVCDEREGNLALTKDGQLHGFLHQPTLPLQECRLSRLLVRDALDGDLAPPLPLLHC